MMEKGKEPIEEEGDSLSPVDDNQSNVMLSPELLAPPGSDTLPSSEGSGESETLAKVNENMIHFNQNNLKNLNGNEAGSANQSSLLDEMETAKDDFFSKFVSLNFADPVQFREQCSLLLMDELSDDDDDFLVPSPPRSPTPPSSPEKQDKPIAVRKPMPPEMLAEVAACDPKRAKRIVTNRMSAIKAKEKKKLYMLMLDHKSQSLRSKLTKLNTRLTLLQTENDALKAQNLALKEKMDFKSKQIQLQDSLNDQVRMENQHMKTVLEQIIPDFKSIIAFPGIENEAIIAPAVTQQLEVQNPIEFQHMQGDFQNQQPYLGQENNNNNSVVEYAPGEFIQLLQQLELQNPQPLDHYDELQNYQGQADHLGQIDHPQQAQETIPPDSEQPPAWQPENQK